MKNVKDAFKRAIAMFAAISAAMSFSLVERERALGLIGPYRSRGHGGKHRPKNRQITGRWAQDRSKYDPRACTLQGNR